MDVGKIVASGSPLELKREIGADSIRISLENCEKDKERTKELIKSLTDVNQILDSEECLTVYAKNAGLLIADIVRALDSSDIRLASVTFSSPSLDDVFMKHTGKRIRTEELVEASSRMFGGRRLLTLLSDTRYVFVRYIRKLVRTPILLFFSLFQPILSLLLFTQLLTKLGNFPGILPPGVGYLQFATANVNAKCFWKCLAIRKLDCS